MERLSFYQTDAAGETRKDIQKRADRIMVQLTAEVMIGKHDDSIHMRSALQDDPAYFLRRSSPIIWG